jgi:hypothetical protein
LALPAARITQIREFPPATAGFPAGDMENRRSSVVKNPKKTFALRLRRQILCLK